MRIKEEIDSRGMTITFVSEKTGIKYMRMRDIYLGKTPDALELRAIAKFLKVKMESLIQ